MMNEKKIIKDLVTIGKVVMVACICFAILMVIVGAVAAESYANTTGESGIIMFITYLIMAVSVYLFGYVANIIFNWRAAMLKHTMKK